MRVMRFIIESSKQYRPWILLTFIMMLLIAVQKNSFPYLIKTIIDMVNNHNYENISTVFILFCITCFAPNIIWGIFDYSQSQFTPHLRSSIINMLLMKLYHYQYSFFQNNLSGKILTQIEKISDSVPRLIQRIIIEFFQLSIVITISVILLSKVHIGFGLAILVWIGIYSIVLYLYYPRIREASALSSEARHDLLGNAADYITQIFNIKIFASISYEKARINKMMKKYINHDVMAWHRSNLYFITQGIICSIYLISCLSAMIYLSKHNLVTPGDFAMVFMLNMAIADWVFQLTNIVRDFIADWSATNQALIIFEEKIEIEDRADATELKITNGQIIFNKVKFHYQGTEPLFQNKSITINSGQKVGLVGHSGGGKSTFVNLIMRLYDVTDGAILIDDQDIRDVRQDSLRASIAMIPQDPSLFHRSLMENIRYGCIDATDEEVIEAAKKANAHEFIEKLSQGYDSLVGERGVKLSGGQRQRIAIAKAILKNAPILILDEATSQLDSITESYIQGSLWDLMQNKTTIVIAHRLSTLLYMDRILVFDKGKIVEDGSHSELLNKNGLYKELWDAQVGGFLGGEKEEGEI